MTQACSSCILPYITVQIIRSILDMAITDTNRLALSLKTDIFGQNTLHISFQYFLDCFIAKPITLKHLTHHHVSLYCVQCCFLRYLSTNNNDQGSKSVISWPFFGLKIVIVDLLLVCKTCTPINIYRWLLIEEYFCMTWRYIFVSSTSSLS